MKEKKQKKRRNHASERQKHTRGRRKHTRGLPEKAKQELLAKVNAPGSTLTDDEIIAIVRDSGVFRDMEAVMRQFYLRTGQRFLAAVRDGTGKREILATKDHAYVRVDLYDDSARLTEMRARIQKQIAGLNGTAEKLFDRITYLQSMDGESSEENTQ